MDYAHTGEAARGKGRTTMGNLTGWNCDNYPRDAYIEMFTREKLVLD